MIQFSNYFFIFFLFSIFIDSDFIFFIQLLKINILGDGNLSSPIGITSDQEGNIIVADTYNNRLQFFRRDGSFIRFPSSSPFSFTFSFSFSFLSLFCSNSIDVFRKVGTRGSGERRFLQPTGLACDVDGTLYVLDTGNHRVQVLNKEGGYIRYFLPLFSVFIFNNIFLKE